jgi:hypothetical protein
VRPFSCDAFSMRVTAGVELGLALIFLGRSLTRFYFGRAVAQFGPSAVALARAPETESEVIPTWVSVVLLSGWAIAGIATVMLALS